VPGRFSDGPDAASLEQEAKGPSSSARPRVRVSNPAVGRGARLKLALRVVITALVLVGALYGFHRTEQFLIRDGRFALSGPDESGQPATLDIIGSAHASRRQIEQVFRDDLGQSIYLLPLADRRATLRTVDWVKDAAVARIWPNRILVRITERKPVAFVTLASSRYGLIDEDGVILPPVPGRFHLPVLKGVRSSTPVPERRDRVRRMMRMMQDLGSMADRIAEVDVTDRNNIKVTQPYEGRMVTLQLGDQNFGLRYKNFLGHYAEIREKMPDATTLDLRLEDRITVVEE
jgi:cell division protein FtsQ